MISNIRAIHHPEYDFREVIGGGQYGTVYRGVALANNTPVAIKVLPKERHDMEYAKNRLMITNEVKHLRKLQGSNHVVKMHDVYQDKSQVYIVQECCPRNMEMVINRPYTEKQVSRMIRRVLLGVQDCHANYVYHGDIKPANILCSHFMSIKLADFGQSQSCSGDTYGCMSRKGTPFFAAPEIYYGNYGLLADIWAVGVVAFILLYKTHPFLTVSDDGSDTYKILSTRPIQFPTSPSIELQSFLEQTLAYPPINRITTRDALKHPFIVGTQSKG